MSSLYVLVPVTHMHDNVNWSREQDRFRDLTVIKLASLGVHDLDSRIRYERVITPAHWDTDYEIHLGATFNLASQFGTDAP